MMASRQHLVNMAPNAVLNLAKFVVFNIRKSNWMKKQKLLRRTNLTINQKRRKTTKSNI